MHRSEASVELLAELGQAAVQSGAEPAWDQMNPSAAATRWGHTLETPKPKTEVVEDASALPFLTDRVREAIAAMLPVLEQVAYRNCIPVRKVEIRGYRDPEEGVSEVVIRQWVDLPGKAAMEYWDRLGLVLDAWIDTLPARLKSTALERVRVSVEWTVHATAA